MCLVLEENWLTKVKYGVKKKPKWKKRKKLITKRMGVDPTERTKHQKSAIALAKVRRKRNAILTTYRTK